MIRVIAGFCNTKKHFYLYAFALLALFVFFLYAGCSKSSGIKFKLEGHMGKIASIAFSPEGKLLASCGGDKTVKIWSTSTWKEIRSFTGHESTVDNVAFSPDGNFLASSSYYLSGNESHLIIWDLNTGQESLNIKKEPGSLVKIVFSVDGKYILTNGGKEGFHYWYPLKVLEASTGNEVLSVEGPDSSIESMAYSRDGKYFFVTDYNRDLRMYDAVTGQSLYRVMANSGCPAGLALSRDGRYVATGCGAFDDGKLSSYKIIIRELETGKTVKELEGDGKPVYCMDISPDGKYIVSGGMSKMMTLWDIASGKEVMRYKDNTGTVTCAVFSPDGRYIASAEYGESIVKIWEVPEAK